MSYSNSGNDPQKPSVHFCCQRQLLKEGTLCTTSAQIEQSMRVETCNTPLSCSAFEITSKCLLIFDHGYAWKPGM